MLRMSCLIILRLLRRVQYEKHASSCAVATSGIRSGVSNRFWGRCHVFRVTVNGGPVTFLSIENTDMLYNSLSVFRWEHARYLLSLRSHNADNES